MFRILGIIAKGDVKTIAIEKIPVASEPFIIFKKIYCPLKKSAHANPATRAGIA